MKLPSNIKKEIKNNRYFSSFESSSGDDWIFVITEKNKIFFTGNDVGYEMIDIKEFDGSPHHSIYLNESETLWLNACWMASLWIREQIKKGK